jgi:hypothetical protein
MKNKQIKLPASTRGDGNALEERQHRLAGCCHSASGILIQITAGSTREQRVFAPVFQRGI